jgi:hypothetical protein
MVKMMNDQAIKYFRRTPEEKKALWDILEKFCKEHDMEEGWYCPYIPLQTCSAIEPDSVNQDTTHRR